MKVWIELTAGSNKNGTKTTAEHTTRELVLNGAKAFCTGAGEADLYTVLVRTGENGPEELSFVIVQKDDPGIDFGERWNGMGLRGSSTKEIICQQSVLPASRLLGDLGSGNTMMKANRGTAIHPGILGLGIANAALDVLKNQLHDKPQLWEFQNTRMVVSDLLIKIHSLELMISHSARLADQQSPLAAQITMEAKILGAQVSVVVTDAVMQLCGAFGYTKGHKIERLYRDAKAIGLMGPTTELSREFTSTEWWTRRESTWENSILTR